MDVLLVHGWGGSDEYMWQSWLEKKLKERKIKVKFPILPNFNLPQEKEWLADLNKQEINFDKETVCIGHSLGCPSLLRLIEGFDDAQEIGLLILVAGFCSSLGIPEIENFVNKDFNFEKIKKKCKRIIVIYSDNDPFISLPKSWELIEKLNAEEILEKGMGHINSGSGLGPYPKILKLVLDSF